MAVGVRVTERDASLYSRSSYAKPGYAVIGTATRGPVGVPTLCTSQNDLKTKFGVQNPNCFGLYAANFYLAEVSRCYYIRVANEGTPATETTPEVPGTLSVSKVTIPGESSGTKLDNLITIESLESGDYLNGYSIVISDYKEGSFKLSVKNKSGFSTYTFESVTLDASSNNYIGKVLATTNLVKLSGYIGESGKQYTITNGTYTLSGGDNGITGLTSSQYVKALDTLISSTYDIEIIATPGVYEDAVIVKGISVAEKRGNSIYLIDPPKSLDYKGVVNWHNGIVNSTGESTEGTGAAYNTSYGAIYWSWQYIYDEIADSEVLVPPSVVVPPVFARNDSIGKPWYAPAGLTRGLLKNVIRSEYVPDSDAIDLLYTDPNCINPIITHPTAGLAVFGQKTLWRQPTSVNRVNVRRLVTYIKSIVDNLSQYLVFEPNDEATWRSFEDLIDPRLRSIKGERGLYDYKIVKGSKIITVEDVDNYRMPAQILIKPTKTAEWLPIDIVISATGANFDEYDVADTLEL